MMRFAVSSLVLMMVALTACTDGTPDEQDVAVAQARAAAAEAATPAQPSAEVLATQCDDTQAQWIVGKPVDEAQLEQARKDAGAERVRVLKPGQAVTMEYDGGRLNVDVDKDGRGVAARCG